MKELYRRSSLERLSSPEQLDRMITITSPGVWLGIGGGVLCVTALLIWAFFSLLPTRVTAQGMLFIGDEREDGIVQCYVPIDNDEQLAAGMTVLVYPASVDSQKYGCLEATIVSVDAGVADTQQLYEQLGADTLVDYFTQEGPVVSVQCELRRDASTASGYYWSSPKGAATVLTHSTYITAEIVVDRTHPITLLLPRLKKWFQAFGQPTEAQA